MITIRKECSLQHKCCWYCDKYTQRALSVVICCKHWEKSIAQLWHHSDSYFSIGWSTSLLSVLCRAVQPLTQKWFFFTTLSPLHWPRPSLIPVSFVLCSSWILSSFPVSSTFLLAVLIVSEVGVTGWQLRWRALDQVQPCRVLSTWARRSRWNTEVLAGETTVLSPNF